MKVEARKRGIKASPEQDLYKMVEPYFLNVFYFRELKKEVPGKMAVNLRYEVKYSYFDDVTALILRGDSSLKLTDKVRANSVIKCPSIITEECVYFNFDGNEESYPELVSRVLDHIEQWYHVFFDNVKADYGDLASFFIGNKEKYPRQAFLVYINTENYVAAEECLRMMPSKMHSVTLSSPQTEEQKQRLADSRAAYGENSLPFGRDDMDCHFDFVTAKKNGLEWNVDRASFGLLQKERCGTECVRDSWSLMKFLKKIFNR